MKKRDAIEKKKKDNNPERLWPRFYDWRIKI